MVISEYLSPRFPAGEMRPKNDYLYYLPGDIFVAKKLSFHHNQLLEEAAGFLASLSEKITNVPDVDLFIDSSLKKEATHSSRIEDVRVGINDAFMDEMDEEEVIWGPRKDDREELRQCIWALKGGVQALRTYHLPLGERVIRDCHRILMHQPRGRNKAPGEYRKLQNWIGGGHPARAVFVPPSPEYVDPAMRNLEAFIQDTDASMAHLIKIALIHWQFESIHPFLDGNGRVGRILILLYLMEKLMIDSPILCMSAFFESNRHEYFDLLGDARRGQKGLMEWVFFFLEGVVTEAQSGREKAQALIDLKNEIMQERLSWVKQRVNGAQEFAELLFHHPSVDSNMLQEKFNLHPATAHRLLEEFTRVGILKEKINDRKNQSFVFADYLEILIGDDID